MKRRALNRANARLYFSLVNGCAWLFPEPRKLRAFAVNLVWRCQRFLPSNAPSHR